MLKPGQVSILVIYFFFFFLFDSVVWLTTSASGTQWKWDLLFTGSLASGF